MTRLTALELCGFKSFADRTRFEFPPGITVVVGPNGSGKSNVVDAIKWVLGEQSVRSLRGRDMTDVIFAGSAGRKPLNAAETSLCFDNRSRTLPTDADEVRITRRVYRSGEGEYLINGEVARLRDIRELFSGTGAATEAYSVIEQGRVDALLVASGRDRRAVFEEAAGITRFRARRAEALRRMERTEQNRQRLADIVGELSERLETVRHQAAKARKYRELTDRLRCLRLAAARRDLAVVDADGAAVTAAIARLEASAAAATTAVATAADQMASIDARLAAASATLDELRGVAGQAERGAAAASATVEQVRRQRAAHADECLAANADLLAADRRLATATRAAQAAAAAATAAEEEESARAAELAAMEAAVVGEQRNAATLRERLASVGARIESLARERERLVAEQEQAERRAADARTAAHAARARAEHARRHEADLGRAIAVIDGALTSLEGRQTTAAAAVADAERTLANRADAVASATHDRAEWEATLGACRERAAVLGELTARRDGVSDATRRLLDAPAGETGVAIDGLVADLVDAPLEWAPLVDIALGPLAHAIALSGTLEAPAALARYRESAVGREALLAGGRLTLVAPPRLPEPVAVPLDDLPGLVGRLDRLVADAGDDTGPVARLLGHAFVADDLDAAARLAERLPARCLVLTRAGEALDGTAVAGTGQQAATTGLVARRAEWNAARSRAEELAATVQAARATEEEARASHAAAAADVRAARARRDVAAASLAEARMERSRRGEEQARLAAEVGAAEGESARADRLAADATRAEQALAATLGTHDDHAAVAAAQHARIAADCDAVEHHHGATADAVARLREARAAAIERLARARAHVDATNAEVERLVTARGAAARRRSAAESRRADLEGDELFAGQVLAAAARAAEDADRSLRDAATLGATLLDERHRRAVDIATGREEAATARAALHARELDAGEVRHRRERILERIREDYGLDLAEGPAPPPASDEPADVPADRESLDREIEQVRRRLAQMPTVNMEALTEAEALAERLAGLESQLSDLDGARQTIEQLISRIDDESRRLLGETIETVRGHFRDLFSRVFGGGQADIVLDPDVDLLETSVEIVARPPGKEPRGIGLLSGGEKTMTCVALLLAIFRSRPSPFCVLDEVDAALDEANVDRFTEVLRDFRDTQFIVVTHSKKTMAAATNLYGVTMEESGVSKRVAVRLESRAPAAMPRAAA